MVLPPSQIHAHLTTSTTAATKTTTISHLHSGNSVRLVPLSPLLSLTIPPFPIYLNQCDLRKRKSEYITQLLKFFNDFPLPFIK